MSKLKFIPILILLLSIGILGDVAQAQDEPTEATPTAEAAPTEVAAETPEAPEAVPAEEAVPEEAPAEEAAEEASEEPAEPSLGDLANTAKNLVTAIKAGHWMAAAMALLLLLVGAVKWAAKKDSDGNARFGFMRWANVKWAKWGLNFVLSTAGMIVTAQMAGVEINFTLVFAAIMTSLSAAGAVELKSDIAGALTK